MQPLRVFLVDDEPAACENLTALLGTRVALPVTVVGTAHDTRRAEDQLAVLRPDAVFLDIEMPREDGLEFLKRVAPAPFDVVFATAFSEHAIKALRLNAVDYILKPIDIPDLNRCVERLVERRRMRDEAGSTAVPQPPLAESLAHPSGKEHLVVRGSNEYDVLDLADVVYLEASGSYSNVHYQKDGVRRHALMSYTLGEYEEVLPRAVFYRIHKSYLVNTTHVDRVKKSGSAAEVVLKDGTVLDVGRRRIPDLLRFLKTGKRDDT